MHNRLSFRVVFLHAVSLCTVVAWIFAVIASFSVAGKPFAGFLLESTMLVSTQQMPDWGGHARGVKTYDRLIKVNGAPVESPADVYREVRAQPPGTPVTYQLFRKSQPLIVTIPTQVFTIRDYFGVCVPWLLSSAAFLALGLTVFWLKPHNAAAQAHLLFSATFSFYLSHFVVFITTHQFAAFYLFALYLMGSSLTHLAFTFPGPNRLSMTRLGELIPYIPPLLLAPALLALFRPLGFSASPQLVDLLFAQNNLWSLWSLLASLYFVGHCAYFAWRGETLRIRSQATVVLLGTLGSLLPATLAYLIPQLLGQMGDVPSWLTWLEMACFHLFPLSIAYAILRHQLFDIHFAIRRATLYTLLITGLAILYLAVAGIGFALLGMLFPINVGPSLPGFVAAFAVALAFRPFHDRLRRAIDRLFLGERADALQVLTRFNQKALPDEPSLAQELLRVLQQALQPKWICLVLADKDRYILGEAPAYLQGACRPSAQTGLHSLCIIVPEADDQALVLNLHVSGDRQHCLFIGPAASDMPYNTDEHAMLRVLASQAAIAFQNAHLLEERIQLSIQEGLARHKATERKQLLMQIVHDIKSDLFNISLALHLAKMKPDHPDALDSIKRSLDRIDSLLSEKVSVIKDGRERSACSLIPALEEAMATLAPQLAQKEQRLDFQGPDAEDEVPLSPIELKQVILNLLSNASKFSPAGTRISLEAQVSEDSVMLRVSDEGPGVPASLLTDLGTGKRADSSIPGSGFGLQNVKALVEAVSGTLSCYNRPVGATFVVHMPLASMPDHAR